MLPSPEDVHRVINQATQLFTDQPLTISTTDVSNLMHEDRRYDLHPSTVSYINFSPRVTAIQSTVCAAYFAIDLISEEFKIVVSSGASAELNIFASCLHDN